MAWCQFVSTYVQGLTSACESPHIPGSADTRHSYAAAAAAAASTIFRGFAERLTVL